MRQPLPFISMIAAAALLAGCTPPDEAPGTDDTPDTLSSTPAYPDSVSATISVSAVDGQVQVRPDSVEVEQGALVRWAGDGDTVWVVAFPEGTPFHEGRPVFYGGAAAAEGEGFIPDDAETGSYKYSVFYPNGEGGYHQIDPKLVVIERRGMGGTD
jgi:hypothetical protein